MSLKIFILPTFVILEVILVIGYIKPNIDAILTKKDEIAVARESIGKVDAISSNAQLLAQSLVSRSEVSAFVDRYYPGALDEERVVDMFNFLAQQSGVIVANIEIVQKTRSQSSDTAYNDAINAGMTQEDALAHAEATARLVPQAYTATVEVFGAYSNLKDFLNRVYRTDRIHETANFSVAQRKRDEGTTEEDAAKGIQDNFLVGTLQAEFPFVARQRASDPLSNPIFQSSAVNFQPAEQALSFVTSPLPVLESGPAGRSNPFE